MITMGVSKIMGFTFAFLLYLFGCFHGIDSSIAWFSAYDCKFSKNLQPILCFVLPFVLHVSIGNWSSSKLCGLICFKKFIAPKFDRFQSSRSKIHMESVQAFDLSINFWVLGLVTVKVLQSLWLAWKNDTPNTDTKQFWNKSMHPYYNSKLNWEGVTCLWSSKEDGSGDTQT